MSFVTVFTLIGVGHDVFLRCLLAVDVDKAELPAGTGCLSVCFRRSSFQIGVSLPVICSFDHETGFYRRGRCFWLSAIGAVKVLDENRALWKVPVFVTIWCDRFAFGQWVKRALPAWSAQEVRLLGRATPDVGVNLLIAPSKSYWGRSSGNASTLRKPGPLVCDSVTQAQKETHSSDVTADHHALQIRFTCHRLSPHDRAPGVFWRPSWSTSPDLDSVASRSHVYSLKSSAWILVSPRASASTQKLKFGGVEKVTSLASSKQFDGPGSSPVQPSQIISGVPEAPSHVAPSLHSPST